MNDKNKRRKSMAHTRVLRQAVAVVLNAVHGPECSVKPWLSCSTKCMGVESWPAWTRWRSLSRHVGCVGVE